MDYSTLVPVVADILKAALPICIIFILTEKLTQLFLRLAFPKEYK